jgi:hypothetical protein
MTPLKSAHALRREHLPPNTGHEPLPELGRRKARCIAVRFLTPPVENRTYGFHRIRLSTFGRSPWGYHEASVSISAASTGLHPCLLPFRQHTRDNSRGQLTRSPGTLFAAYSLYFVLPKARGLRRQSSSWCPWLSHAQTPLPHPTLRQGLGVSLGSPFPTSHSP